jgi:hypothetical protein
MVYMPARPKNNNERLRELIERTGLSQPQALALFNRGLGPAAYSASAWKSFLVNPASARFRPLKDALLKHAEKELYLAGVPHSDHVFREFGFALRAALALGDHEGLEAFLLQTSQDIDGGDVGVPLGAALVLAGSEDRRRREAHLLFTKRRVAAKNVGVAREAGGELGHVHSFKPKAPEPCPVHCS